MDTRPYALFIGRWQPLHNGHDYIIQKALADGNPVAIGVRNTPISDSDPYSMDERIEMIKRRYADDDVIVFPMPNIKSVNIGRKVGYGVIRFDVPENIAGISATAIRDAMANGDQSWKERVPYAVARYLEERERSKKGLVIWFTGLSGAGKSTLVNILAEKWIKTGKKVAKLDGDIVRTNFTRDLGFSKADRDENIFRISHLANALANCGMLTMVACISPYHSMRNYARHLIGPNRFFLVYMNCDIEILKKRDPKGLYAKALAGEIKGFTGIDDPYEPPENADITIHSDNENIDESIKLIESHLRTRFPNLVPQNST